jgi:hypothetical protein
LPPFKPFDLIEPGTTLEEACWMVDQYEALHAEYAHVWPLATIECVRKAIRLLKRHERALRAKEWPCAEADRRSRRRRKTILSAERAFGDAADAEGDDGLKELLEELGQLEGANHLGETDSVMVNANLDWVLAKLTDTPVKLVMPDSYEGVCKLIVVLRSCIAHYCHLWSEAKMLSVRKALLELDERRSWFVTHRIHGWGTSEVKEEPRLSALAID